MVVVSFCCLTFTCRIRVVWCWCRNRNRGPVKTRVCSPLWHMTVVIFSLGLGVRFQSIILASAYFVTNFDLRLDASLSAKLHLKYFMRWRNDSSTSAQNVTISQTEPKHWTCNTVVFCCKLEVFCSQFPSSCRVIDGPVSTLLSIIGVGATQSPYWACMFATSSLPLQAQRTAVSPPVASHYKPSARLCRWSQWFNARKDEGRI